MKLSEYCKQQGATIPISIIARIASYHPIGLNTMYNRGDLLELNEIINDSETRFQAICKVGKK